MAMTFDPAFYLAPLDDNQTVTAGYNPPVLKENANPIANNLPAPTAMAYYPVNKDDLEVVCATPTDIKEVQDALDRICEEGAEYNWSENEEDDVTIANDEPSANGTLLPKAPTWNHMKYLPEFLEPWKPIPGNPTLREICIRYPNHLFGAWLDAFIQWKWSDGLMMSEVPKSTRDRWIYLSVCKTPRNFLMKRLERRWMDLGPDGMTSLDNIEKIYDAHTMGTGKQLLVRDPVRYKKALKAKKNSNGKKRTKRE